MMNKRRDKKDKRELYLSLIELLMKIVGESVQDRLIRAMLVGALAAAGHYIATADEPSSAVAQPQPSQATSR